MQRRFTHRGGSFRCGPSISTRPPRTVNIPASKKRSDSLYLGSLCANRETPRPSQRKGGLGVEKGMSPALRPEYVEGQASGQETEIQSAVAGVSQQRWRDPSVAVRSTSFPAHAALTAAEVSEFTRARLDLAPTVCTRKRQRSQGRPVRAEPVWGARCRLRRQVRESRSGGSPLVGARLSNGGR